MKRWKFVMLCAALVMALCGVAWAEVSGDMVISGDFATGYTVSTWYSSSVSAHNADGELTFSIISGDIPPGFYIRQNGSDFYLQGVPDRADTWLFTLMVTDRHNRTASRDLSVTIVGEHPAGKLVISGDELISGMAISGDFETGYTTSTWYSSSVTVYGAEGDLTFSIESRDLPPGFFIRQDGSDFYLEGVPSKAGSWDFTVGVTDRQNPAVICR